MGLTWENIDLDAGHLEVTGTLGRSKAGLFMGPPKSKAGRRRVHLDAGTVEILREYRAGQAAIIGELGGYYDAGPGVVFASAKGGFMEPATLTRQLKAVGLRAGVSDLTAHQLRHFHASLQLQAGANIADIAQRLGHSTPVITARTYVHSLDGQGQVLADKFAGMMA